MAALGFVWDRYALAAQPAIRMNNSKSVLNLSRAISLNVSRAKRFIMRVVRFLTCIEILAIATPALAADYHCPRRDAFDAPPVYVGFPTPKPNYWVAAPP
jgi:hypothetical protein